MTELNTNQGMHIESDPQTGAIARATVTPEANADIADNEGQGKTPYDPRKEIMDKIYANRADQYKQELEYAAEISDVNNFNSPESEPKDKLVEEIEEIEENPVVQKEKPKDSEVVKQPTRRKVQFGNQSLELTDQELEQLAVRALYAQNAPQQQVQQHVQQPVEQPIQPKADASLLKDIARKITYGSEEESAHALAEFANLTADMARNNQPAPEQLVQAATNQAIAQINFQNNLNTIASEYKDVFEDGDLTIIAARKVGELRNKYNTIGQPRNDLDLYREACKLTRDKFVPQSETTTDVNKSNSANQQAATIANVSQTRVERKRSAPQPAAAVNRVQQMQQQSQYPTGSAIVNAMRKSRGQSAM
jgi:hypothetical protein